MSQKTSATTGDTPDRFTHEQRVLAARIRVKADKNLGVDTPKWIVALAEQRAS